MNPQASSAASLLRHILEMCSKGTHDTESLREIQSYIKPDFGIDIVQLLGKDFYVLEPGFTTGTYAKFVIKTPPTNPELFLAILVFTGGWSLVAFMERCPVCQGAQRDSDGEPCEHCFATGWGNQVAWEYNLKQTL